LKTFSSGVQAGEKKGCCRRRMTDGFLMTRTHSTGRGQDSCLAEGERVVGTLLVDPAGGASGVGREPSPTTRGSPSPERELKEPARSDDGYSKHQRSRESSRSRVCLRASSSGIPSPASIWASSKTHVLNLSGCMLCLGLPGSKLSRAAGR